MNIIILVALIKILLITEKPLFCAGIFTGVNFFFGLIFGYPFLAILIGGLINFALASLYFGLLNRSEDNAWWAVCIGGVVFWIALPIILS